MSADPRRSNGEPVPIDVIVVLAGAKDYRERTAQAARLWRGGHAPRIVLTNDGLQGGWSSALQRNPFFIERAAWALESHGVPPNCITRLPEITNSTYEEITLLRRFAEKANARSLMLVTSAYHTRRTLWIARRVFDGSGKMIYIEPVPPNESTAPPTTWWLHQHGWQDITSEYLKLLYYWWRY